MNSIFACCHSAKLCAHAARAFRPQQLQPKVTTCMGQNHYFYINFRVNFVKPLTLKLIEIGNFGLFCKVNFKILQNMWFSRQIMVFIKMA